MRTGWSDRRTAEKDTLRRIARKSLALSHPHSAGCFFWAAEKPHGDSCRFAFCPTGDTPGDTLVDILGDMLEDIPRVISEDISRWPGEGRRCWAGRRVWR